jgi:hypothetical protein
LALPGKRGLRLLLEGGLTAQTAGLSWAGTLSELTLSSVVDAQRPFVSLASAMPLQVAAAGVSAGPADLVGAGWSARLEQSRYAQGRWQTAGSMRSLPVVALLAEFPEWSSAVSATAKDNGDTLRLNGEWDIGSADRSATPAKAARVALPGGRVRLWRESGDLSIGVVAARSRRGEPEPSGQGRTSRRPSSACGASGWVKLTASSARRVRPSALISRQAPWRGEFRLDVPDLAWAGPAARRRLATGRSSGGRDAACRNAGEAASSRANGVVTDWPCVRWTTGCAWSAASCCCN